MNVQLASGLLATATGPHLFWITSRAAGVAALMLSSLAVSAGLLMSVRLPSVSKPDLRVAHEALSLATLGALAVHGLALLGDGYMHFSLGDIALPFLSSYRTAWTAAGIVAFWALALLGLSYYARKRIGPQRWRKLHRFTALAWVLGIVHALGEGTDAGQTWFLAMTGLVTIPALALLAFRRLGPALKRGGAAAAAPAPVARPRLQTENAR
jgi:methionine sulfoxide reductase heme-binding subunit